MSKHTLSHKRGFTLIIGLIAILMITSMACNLLGGIGNLLGGGEDEETGEADVAIQEEVEDLPVNEEYEEPEQEAETAPEPTEAPAVVDHGTTELSGDVLYLVGKQAVIKDEYYTYGVFVAGNPRTDCMYDYAQFDYVAYDASNNVLYTENGGFIETVLPGGQTMELIYFPEEAQDTDHFEVTLDAGDCKAAPVTADAFTISNEYIIPDEYSPTATAIITNNLDDYQTEIFVGALAYDANGNIVGAGTTYMNQLFPSDYTGVEIYLNTNEDAEIASVEFLPTHSYFSEIGVDIAFFDTAYLADQLPWVQIDNQYETVFYIVNDDPINSAVDMEYQLTIVDENNNVLSVETGWIDEVLPGDVTPVYISAYLPDGVSAYTHWVEITPGEFGEPSFASNPFTSSNYKINEDGYWPVITFDLTNNSDKAVTGVEMIVIVYDENDNFIGGGRTTSDILSGNSTVGQEVTVNLAGTADSVDVYLVVDYWTEIEGQD